MTRVAGTTVLVTGASSGIGRATARTLAQRGARLLVSGRDQSRLDEVVRQTGALGCAVDLSTGDGPDQLTSWALGHGPVHSVVHSAGIGWSGPVHQASDSDVQRVLAVNVRAPIQLTGRLLPPMLERGAGHLVFVGSIAGLLGVPEESAYAASKAALHGYARSLAVEVAQSGVEVSIVAPGVVNTGFFQRRGTPYRRRFPRPIPAERVATAIADAVEHDRAEVIVPAWLRVPVLLQAAAPTLYHRLASRSAGG
jgi:short-subunit dehydrogenase